MPSRFLFVDDEPDVELLVRQLYRRALRAGEIDVVFADSGVSALELLADDADIAAVFTDINMPRMDGLTLLGEIRKLPRDIPVVLISAYGDRQNLRRAMNGGAFDFLTKPIDFEDLEATRARVVSRLAEMTPRADPVDSESLSGAFRDAGDRASPRSESAERPPTDDSASSIEAAAAMAHEVRDPLNFIVNFSTLSGGLLEELRSDLREAAERLGPELGDRIGDTVDLLGENLEKVLSHGVRANSIVASMLNRARGVAGEKEPTDIHQVLDAQLALARQAAGFRKTDLNVRVSRDYAPHLPVVALDRLSVSRALLIVLENAYDALAERARTAGDEYRPTLSVSTRRRPDAVEIRIRDNGPGVAEADMSRIFLPRFSTKQSGRGVGIGLSLTHEVVVAQHHGDISVESSEGDFAEFTISFPLEPVVT